MLKKLIGLNLSVILFFWLDQFLKLFFQKNPTISYGGDFFWGLLSFNYYTNAGVAFGVKLNQLFLIGFIFLLLIILAILLIQEYKRKNLLTIFSLSLILAGASSNLWDRLKFRYVIDYIDVKWFTVFNLADAMITIGVLIFALAIFFNKDLDKKREIS